MNDSHGIPLIMNDKYQGMILDDLVVHQHYDEKVDVYHNKQIFKGVDIYLRFI